MTDPKSEVHQTPGGAMMIVHHLTKGSDAETARAQFIVGTRGVGAEARVEILKFRMEPMTPLQALEFAAGLVVAARTLGATEHEWLNACEAALEASAKTPESVHQTYTESAAPNAEPKEPS